MFLLKDNYSGSTGKKSLQFEMECDEDEASFSEDGKPSQVWVEARSVYIQLKSLVDSLKISHDDDSGMLREFHPVLHVFCLCVCL